GDNLPETSPATNLTVPSPTGINGFIAPFWDDLVPGISSDAGIYVGSRGTAPSREFVVQWQEVGLAADPSASLTFQVVLREQDGRALIHYGPMRTSDPTSLGASATIGAENYDGTGGTLHGFNQPGAVRSGASVILEPR
ncbi:MAG: hypothetical protein AAFX99_24300, partial [Myxococcota bacterium]